VCLEHLKTFLQAETGRVRLYTGALTTGIFIMAKGQQRSNKESKKPRKDSSPPKPVSGEAVRPTVTTAVIPRGKEKNK